MNNEGEFNINCEVVRLYGEHTGMGYFKSENFCNLTCSIINNANQTITGRALGSSHRPHRSGLPAPPKPSARSSRSAIKHAVL